MLAYQVSGLSQRHPKQAMPLAITLQAACVASAILSGLFFFAAPIVASLATLVCSTVATALLARDAGAVA